MRRILLFCWIICILACSSTSERPSKTSSPRIRKQVVLVTPKKGETYSHGETIIIQVSHRQEDSVIDSLQIEFGGIEDSAVGDSYDLNSGLLRVGNPGIKLTAFYEGKTETLYPKVKILAAAEPVEYGFRIINEYQHDPDAYTQGLFFDGSTLYESTGNESAKRTESVSSLRKVALETGDVLEQVILEKKYFGEGCTMWNDRIYQLTWTSKTAFVYDKTLSLSTSFNYSMEGWGLTTTGDTLLFSDGSENIYMMNPEDFSEIDRFQVFDHKGPVKRLNELEFFEGNLYANIYSDLKDEVVIIDIVTGQVTGRINFNNIVDRSALRGFDYAMNGIAFHQDGRMFVTGKWWPKLFEVEIFPKTNS